MPGHKGNFVEIKDAAHKKVEEQPLLPVPTVAFDDGPQVGHKY